MGIVTDLQELKKILETRYAVKFKVEDVSYRDTQDLVYENKKGRVRVYVGKYTCYTEKFGKEHIGFDFWNGESGKGGPNDSMEELFDNLDSIGLPRRADASEQLSLW